MSTIVKKISDLTTATSIQGDELLEIVQDGINVKVRADDLTIPRPELATWLESKVDKQYGKVLSDRNFTQSEKDKLSSLPTGSYLNSMLNDKVDSEWGKGLIEPAPEDGKQYARKNNAWVEVGGGLRTYLDGTTLYMTSDGSNPDPAFAPVYTLFSYEFDVEEFIGTNPNGDYLYYGVNEAVLPPIGTFINNIENDVIGVLRAAMWGYEQGSSNNVVVMAENSDFLLTYSNNVDMVIRDQNNEILRFTLTPENIHNPYEGALFPEGFTPPPAVLLNVPLTQEQYDLLPQIGTVFVDIGLMVEPVPEPEIFSYEFEIDQFDAPDGSFTEYGVSEGMGTFIKNEENDKIGKLTTVVWWYSSDYGNGIEIRPENTDYIRNNSFNIEVGIRDQNGKILSVTGSSDDVYSMETGQAFLDMYLTEEQFDLFPKSGIVFVDIILEPYVELKPW